MARPSWWPPAASATTRRRELKGSLRRDGLLLLLLHVAVVVFVQPVAVLALLPIDIAFVKMLDRRAYARDAVKEILESEAFTRDAAAFGLEPVRAPMPGDLTTAHLREPIPSTASHFAGGYETTIDGRVVSLYAFTSETGAVRNFMVAVARMHDECRTETRNDYEIDGRIVSKRFAGDLTPALLAAAAADIAAFAATVDGRRPVD